MADDKALSVPKTATVKIRPPILDEAYASAKVEVEQLRLDRDHAIAEKDHAVALCNDAKNHIMRLNDEIVDLKSQRTMYQLERDEAVSKYAKLQERVRAAQDVINHCDLPPVPVQRVATDAEAPKTYVTDPGPNAVALRPPTPDEMLAKISGSKQ